MVSIWLLLLIISCAGAIGGIVNALLTDNGFALPRTEQTDGSSIIRPGFIGNILIGAISAGISWGLYGPMANILVAGSRTALSQNPVESYGVTLSSLVGAVLVGVGGARWLTNEVDKNLLKAAASKAASSQAAPNSGQQIALSSPVKAFNIAKNLPTPQ
jgi:hypothetical protein